MIADEVKKIRDHLTSPRAETRKKAFAEIKKLSLPVAMDLLIETLSTKNDDVQSDLSKIFISYKEAALPYLVKAFSHSSWAIRRAASRVIGSLGDGALAKFLDLIPKNEEDPDYWMVQTLSIMGGEAITYLIKTFNHSSLKIRLASIRAAANVKDPRIVSALIPLLEENNWPVRKAAFDSLMEVHHLNTNAIKDALRNCSREAKYWVIQLAAEKRDPEMIPLFCGIVDNDPEESKLEAIKAMAPIESREVQKVLVGYLAHRSWIVRKTAADAIWQQGLGVSDELLKAVHDQNTDARYWSVKLLGKTNEPVAFEKVLERLNDPHASVRAAACQALGSLGDKRAIAPLMTILSDKSEEVRTNAILAIGQIGEKDLKYSDRPSIPHHLRPENQMSCPSCGKSVGRNFSFCPFCLGQLRSMKCRKCGRQMETAWKGCPDCGEPS